MPGSIRRLFWLALIAPGTGAGQAIPYESIVKIENTAVEYNYATPWNAGHYLGNTGTGFFIGGNRFLTNAHVLSSSSRLMVTLTGDPTPHPARLLFIGHDCDLALFELEDPALSERLQPLAIGVTPTLDSEVRAVGFPVGGERLSVTRGVVSRIDYVGYAHTEVDQHLAVQIDAAINPGNSGGPVLQGGQVVGVAFQGLGEAENTGYMIPPPVIRRFLADVEDGHYDGYVDLGLSELPLVSPAQRAALGLEEDGRGVLVGHVLATGSADGSLREGDILLAIDGLPIASDGSVVVDGERLNMAEVVERRFVDDRVEVDLRRGGSPLKVELTLRTLPALKILATDYDNPPRYVVAAGLVFQPVNRNLFSAMQPTPAVGRTLQEHLQENRFLERPDIVVFTQVLPASVNSGTEEFVGGVVESIDGTPVRTLHDVHRLLNGRFDQPQGGEFIEIRLRDVGRPLLLRRTEAAAAHARILESYGIRSDSRLGAETRYERPAAALAAESAAEPPAPVEDATAPEPMNPTDPDPRPRPEPLPDQIEPLDPEPDKDPAVEPTPDPPPATEPQPLPQPVPEPGPEAVPGPGPDEVPVPGADPAL